MLQNDFVVNRNLVIVYIILHLKVSSSILFELPIKTCNSNEAKYLANKYTINYYKKPGIPSCFVHFLT